MNEAFYRLAVKEGLVLYKNMIHILLKRTKNTEIEIQLVKKDKVARSETFRVIAFKIDEIRVLLCHRVSKSAYTRKTGKRRFQKSDSTPESYQIEKCLS